MAICQAEFSLRLILFIRIWIKIKGSKKNMNGSNLLWLNVFVTIGFVKVFEVFIGFYQFSTIGCTIKNNCISDSFALISGQIYIRK